MDRVLTLNVGSSSLKWSLFDEGETRIDGGDFGRYDALDAIAHRIGDVDGVAHRMVHGGDRFVAPVVVDRSVRSALDEVAALAPLHMFPALEVLDAARVHWADATHVVAFDTAFHRTIPPEESTYAVPRSWREKFGVRRYGFHGLSVEYAMSCVDAARVLVFHLGSGASITAVRDGQSVATTMGMTPLEGLVMATRSGSIDPGAILHLARAGLSIDEIERGLVHEGGLVALAGRSDMREIARAAVEGDERARFARAHFVRSVAKHACSLLPALGSVDALVFTGGIGENDADVRDRILAALPFRARVQVVHAREDISLVRASRQASCNHLGHAPPEANPRRDRLQ
jgi:acetate kinase